MGLVEGKVALVTGAGSGIGRASALLFAQEGAKVVVGDISTDGGQETTDLIRSAGGDAVFIRCDVAVEADVQAAVAAAVNSFGTLHCAHNNAGIQDQATSIHDYSLTEWNHILRINLNGCMLSMKHEAAVMMSRGGGAIVNTASAAGLRGVPLHAGYVGSKHGVIGITKAVALELAASGIRVNAVCPGVIRTPMVDRWMKDAPATAQAIQAAIPMGRPGESLEVAEAAVWLCSERSSFITGSIIPVDGGETAA